ncbi:MAG: transglutaminase domain-containing protein [Minisyncoccales bacterium]
MLKKILGKLFFKEELEELQRFRNQISKNSIKSYYENAYPKKDITYVRTDKETLKIDIRQFLNPNNFLLPTVGGKNDDEIALNSLKWVIDNISYVKDKKQYGMNEYWAYNYETLKSKKGDCDDMAILLYCIMRKNGIPYWKIRVTAGNVDDGNVSGGHCFVTYLDEERLRWVLLDCCFHPNKKKIKDRKDYKDETYYKTTWFSFNENYSYAKDVKYLKYSNIK